MIYLLLGILVLILLGVGAVIYEFLWVAKSEETYNSSQLYYVVGKNEVCTLFRVFYCTSADKALEMWSEDFDYTWKILLVTTDYKKTKETICLARQSHG